MATRQYIGARYVIKIYKNSQSPNSAEWEANTSYEPLTMVTYQNSSYLSRKAVPVTVGNPASNGDYWAITGAYNGQIASLQSQINNIESLISALTTKTNITKASASGQHKILAIGDSYGMRTESQPTWTEWLTTRYTDARQHSYSSIGFGTSSPTPGNFLSVITQFYNELSSAERDEITDIIVGGGWNDASMLAQSIITSSQLQHAIFDFVDYCNTNFVNAKVWIAFLGWQTIDCVQPDATFAALNEVQSIYELTSYKNLYHMPNTSSVMKCSRFMDSSYFHPNPTGSAQLFNVISNSISGGADFDYEYDLSAADVTPIVGSATFVSGHVAIHNDVAKIQIVLSGVAGGGNTVIIRMANNAFPTGMLTSNLKFSAVDYNQSKPLYCAMSNKNISLYGTDTATNSTVIIDLTLNARYEY